MGALSGLRVVDFSLGVSGPWCTKLLAGLGAEVIKIEPMGGDPSRRQGPFPKDIPQSETSGTFLHLNTGKLGITLNIESASGREIALRLAARSDVLVESHSPGVMAEKGLGPEQMASVNEGLIYVSVTPFGQDGPYSGYEASEIILYALGGYMMLTGDQDREPLKAYGDQTQMQAGQQAATATMVALFAREASGRGQHVDISIMEAATFMLGGAPQAFHHRGDVAKRAGARLSGMSPRMFYPSTIRPCRDGYVHVHTNVRHPDMLSVLMGEPDLFSPRVMDSPLGHADEIDALMDPWLRERDKREIVRTAQDLRLPFTEVMSPSEVANDVHHQERGFWTEFDHPETEPIVQPGPPIRLSKTPWETKRAPRLGEHNDLILGDVLGFSPQEMTILSERGVI